MANPYRRQPKSAFWRFAVEDQSPIDFDPVTEAVPPFQIGRTDPVVAAGSCFAQHVARHLKTSGFNFLTSEEPGSHSAAFSARYGNIYTARQLRQLFERAYGLRIDRDQSWVRPDGCLVFPTRPQEFPEGFASVEDLQTQRDWHHAAVREALETCSVFIFTLGLTEAWICDQDGMAAPVSPGAINAQSGEGITYSFRNLDVEEVIGDLVWFVANLRAINPAVKIVLTVSPVPMVATFEKRHVVVSNAYSKAVLRVAAETASRRCSGVFYFPSYEIITAFPGSMHFEADKRSVRPESIARVMEIFTLHLLDSGEGAPDARLAEEPVGSSHAGKVAVAAKEFDGILCDEVLNARV